MPEFTAQIALFVPEIHAIAPGSGRAMVRYHQSD
jgi:hypothetical protein